MHIILGTHMITASAMFVCLSQALQYSTLVSCPSGNRSVYCSLQAHQVHKYPRPGSVNTPLMQPLCAGLGFNLSAVYPRPGSVSTPRCSRYTRGWGLICPLSIPRPGSVTTPRYSRKTRGWGLHLSAIASAGL